METVWIIAVVIIVFLILTCSSKKEKFGPVKNIQRIPLNNCYTICDQYWDRCMREFSNVPGNWCNTRYHSCINICNHSNHFAL